MSDHAPARPTYGEEVDTIPLTSVGTLDREALRAQLPSQH